MPGREIKDEDLAGYMKQSGLGTPATRAANIEKLIAVGYIERKKKALLPTEKGKALINHVPLRAEEFVESAFHLVAQSRTTARLILKIITEAISAVSREITAKSQVGDLVLMRVPLRL